MRSFVTAAALTLGLVALPATVAHAGQSFQVGVKASSTTVKLGQKLTFTGHVRPGAAAAGHTVKLQEKYGPKKPWRTKDTDRVGASGKYRLGYRPTTATIREYRMVMPASKNHRQGISKILEVSVYTWSKLTSHESVNQRGIYAQDKIHINGTAYDDSLRAFYGDASSIEYNLNHLCTGIRGTFGLSDVSETGAQATVSLDSDGSQIYTNTFGLGQSDFQDLALAKPLKIRVATQSTSTGVNGYGALGTPQVFCTAPFGG